jgi:fatty acid desaturase/membrane-associated phospholipid phosphatase
MPDTRLNWAILTLAAGACMACLGIASHAGSTITAVAAAIVFSFFANTLFALLHEAVHGNFSPSPRANDAAGMVAASFFPTSFTMQRAFHLTHHRNNRSDIERFDYIGPDENVPLKTAQWFTILTGLYWVSAPIFCLFFAIFGGLVPWRRLVAADSGFSRQTSAGAFLGSVTGVSLWRVRGEVALAIALQAAMIRLFDLGPGGWLLCYGAFALNWSSLQYADHAFSPLDAREGAWNLRVGPITRRFFLNYHDHLVHHRDPSRGWRNLPAHVSAADASASFARILYLMWMGPRLLPGAGRTPRRQRLLDRSVVAAHTVIFGCAFLLVYGSSSRDYHSIAQPFDVAIPLDAYIPFVPAFGLFYLSLNLLLLLVPVVLKQPARTLPFLATLMTQLVIAWLCYHFYPVALPPAQPVDPANISSMLYRLSDTSNLDGNGLPSLHVAFAISCAWVLTPHVGRRLAPLLWAWSALICASTLLVYQHYLLDVAAGAVLAVATMGVLYPRLKHSLSRAETDYLRPVASTG